MRVLVFVFLLISNVCAFLPIKTGEHGLRRPILQTRRVSTAVGASEQDSDDLGMGSNMEGGNDDDNVDESVFESVLPPGIVPMELNSELKSSFMSYAMSTILGRALPDARDGLKPVHRRVLFAMQGLGLTPDAGYRKCARVVGEVLGKFHPHGDQSVYDALVRMAQDFVMLHPLVSGHGNFGSVDNDPAAAMRYTEAKLSPLAAESLLADIKEDTVDFVANFDGNEEEPLVLPARLPMLLLNGASGIAVGMATNIPPHNLGELADAVIALIQNPDLSDEELFKIVPAPDFPTGGQIMGLETIKTFYETGHGSCVMRARCHIEQIKSVSKGGTKRERSAIIVTELPYMTNKAALLEKIADLVNDKKIEGIVDLRDESDRDGIRVVIELKRDAIPAIVQNNLYKKTSLQTSFSGNMLALVDDGKQPMRMSLRNALEIFVQFRFDTVRKRTSFILKKLENRDHIVQGLLLALGRIDAIIELVRKSKDTANAKGVLMSEEYGLSTEQADAILGLRLSRLTGLEEQKLQDEHKVLEKDIASMREMMDQDGKVFNTIVEETRAIKAKHATPRRSEIVHEGDANLSDMDLLANDRSVIIMTRSGYIKRMPVEEFDAQSRGGKGKAGTKLKEADSVAHFLTCNDHDSVLFISDKGVAYSVKAYQVPLTSRTSKGAPLPQVLPINADEVITSVIPVDKFEDEEFLVLLTSQGYVKKTPLKAFSKISARGLIIISLGDGDALRWARRCRPDQDLLIATRDGFASRMASRELRVTGRTSRGVRALNLREGDEMTDMDILQAGSGKAGEVMGDTGDVFVLAVTKKGYGKRIQIDEFRTQRRGGKGVIAIKFKDKAGGSRTAAAAEGKVGETDALSCMRVCSSGDEVVLGTNKGSVVRQRVNDLSIQSRAATGVLIQKLSAADSIVQVDVIPPERVDDFAGATSADGEEQNEV